MSNSISTLLLRNLSDVFGENDPMRRRAAINEIFHENAVFYDPKGGIFRDRAEIDRIAGELRATHHDFRGDLLRTICVVFRDQLPQCGVRLFFPTNRVLMRAAYSALASL